MSTYHNVGHFNNVSNFEDLIAYCSTYGSSYKPSKNAIQLSELQVLYANAVNCVNSLSEKQTIYKKAIVARAQTFEPLSKLSTRVLNAFKICATNDDDVKHLKYYVNKNRTTSDAVYRT